MEPLITLATMATSLLWDNRADIAKRILDRLTDAKDKYQDTVRLPFSSPLEEKRQELLLKLSTIQNKLMLMVYDQRFLERVLPF